MYVCFLDTVPFMLLRWLWNVCFSLALSSFFFFASICFDSMLFLAYVTLLNVNLLKHWQFFIGCFWLLKCHMLDKTETYNIFNLTVKTWNPWNTVPLSPVVLPSYWQMLVVVNTLHISPPLLFFHLRFWCGGHCQVPLCLHPHSNLRPLHFFVLSPEATKCLLLFCLPPPLFSS